MASLITQQTGLLKDLEKNTNRGLVKESMTVLSQLNQVSIKFNLYKRIKEAQQKDDKIIKMLEKVQ